MPIFMEQEADQVRRCFEVYRNAARRQERSYWLACGLWAVLLLLVLSGCSVEPSTRRQQLDDRSADICAQAGGIPRWEFDLFSGCDPAPPQPCPPARFRPDHFEQPAQPPAEEMP